MAKSNSNWSVAVFGIGLCTVAAFVVFLLACVTTAITRAMPDTDHQYTEIPSSVDYSPNMGSVRE